MDYHKLIEQLRTTESRSKREMLDAAADTIEAAVADIEDLLWLNGNCEYCKHGRLEKYNSARRWHCGLGSAADCRPVWRGPKEE